MISETGKTEKVKSISGVTLDMIMEHINKGGSVYIYTCLKATIINKKAFERWEKVGYQLLKEKNGSLYMGKGKGFVCIDYCNFMFK